MHGSFVLSSPDVTGLPDHGHNEVAIFGRSNVGKSSLLNALAHSKIARTSKTPGRTQLLNLFFLETEGPRLAVLDLPGYGFAEVPPPIRRAWDKMVARYLGQREALTAVLLLIDARRGAEAEDLEVFQAIAESKRRVFIVATKIDKLGKAHQRPAIQRIAQALGLPKEAVWPASARTGQGLEALTRELTVLAERPGQDKTSVRRRWTAEDPNAKSSRDARSPSGSPRLARRSGDPVRRRSGPRRKA